MRNVFIIGFLPQRIVVAVLCFLGLTVSYVMRFCLSLAMTEMAESPKTIDDLDACPFPDGFVPTNSTKVVEYQWSEATQGIIHSSFFWGYVVAQLPGGILADRIGARRIIVIGILLTSIFSILTPVATQLGDWKGLVAIRVILGLAQGLVYPSLHTIVAQWIPKKELATWASVVFSGSLAGNFTNYLLSGILMGYFNLTWHSLFHIYGVVGIVWTLVFVMTTYPTPGEHPYLSDREKTILEECMDAEKNKGINGPTPWYDILTSWPVWAVVIAMIGHDWGLFALITDLPKFMKSILHFNVKANGLLNALSYVLIWVVSILAGILVDFAEGKHLISTTTSRKLGTTIASVGPSVGLVVSVYTDCDIQLAVIFLITGMAFMGFFYSSLKVNVIDIAPNHPGAVAALSTSIASFSGVLAPYIIGYITTNNSLLEWRVVMWLSFAIMSVTNLVYIIAADSKPQPWNSASTLKDPKWKSTNQPI